jgi:acyl carrier protein phosphodiesterase
LAKNWATYSEIPLELFTKSVYNLLDEIKLDLPIKSQQFINYMIEYNILFNYKYKDGIEKVLNGMNKRTKGKSQMNLAIEDLHCLEAEFEADFTLFFKELIAHTNQKLKKIDTTV